MSTSSNESSIQTSTSTRESSTEPWGSPPICSLCCSPSPEWLAGLLIGIDNHPHIPRNEYLDDKENNIIRPRQNYQGKATRNYVPLESRPEF